MTTRVKVIVHAARQTFPRKLKLNTPLEFKEVFAQSSKLTGRGVLLLLRPNHKPYGRLGITVAKRTVKRAVDRVQLKRVIRETFRLNQSNVVGFDVVVIVRKSSVYLDYSDFRGSLVQQWKKIPQLAKKYY